MKKTTKNRLAFGLFGVSLIAALGACGSKSNNSDDTQPVVPKASDKTEKIILNFPKKLRLQTQSRSYLI